MPRTPKSQPTPEPADEPMQQPATEPTVVYVQAPSYLDRVRGNQMGPLTAALLVGILVGLLLSLLVPSPANVWALILLGVLLSAAVGFSVRYLSVSRDWRAWLPAFLGAVIGTHIMAVTGTVNSADVGKARGLLDLGGVGFDDALLASLATPAVSVGCVLAGLVAVIIAGWSVRTQD